MALKRLFQAAMAAVVLTAREYAILELLVMHRGKVVTKSEIYDHIFDETDDTLSNLIEVHVSNLRKKLGRDLLIVSFANGLWMSLRVARRLERDHGVACRVLDLRWLSPLPVDDLMREAEAVGRVLVVDETRRSGGVSEGVIAALIDRGFGGPIARVAAVDSFVPLGAAANHVLVSEAEIERAAIALVGRCAGIVASAAGAVGTTAASVAVATAGVAASAAGSAGSPPSSGVR